MCVSETACEREGARDVNHTRGPRRSVPRGSQHDVRPQGAARGGLDWDWGPPGSWARRSAPPLRASVRSLGGWGQRCLSTGWPAVREVRPLWLLTRALAIMFSKWWEKVEFGGEIF